MNVSLTPELEKFVSAKVESGRYNSASEVVREALRRLEEHDSARAARTTGSMKDFGTPLVSIGVKSLTRPLPGRAEGVSPEQRRKPRA